MAQKEMHPRDAMLQLIDLTDLLAENAEQLAKSRKRLYDAYIAEGFMPEQAIELLKGGGI